jgi:hypothetical protein
MCKDKKHIEKVIARISTAVVIIYPCDRLSQKCGGEGKKL